MSLTFHIKTYGCQMNERDSEATAALLEAHGYVPAAGEGVADIVIINTCTVRGKAEEKALGKAGLLTAAKRERPGRIVGLIGCVVQRLKGDLVRKVRGLDFAVGPHRLPLLPAVIEAVIAGRGPVVEAGEDRLDPEALAGHTPGMVAAFVNILIGCDRHCSYCVVPSVRGSEWSRPAANVIAEVRRLADNGVKEVTLLGQSVMSYGRANPVWDAQTLSPHGFREPLARLLEAVNEVPGITRLRFTSGHPSGCTAEIARAMAELPVVCAHLHLPVQSGCDRILRRMRRGYTAATYRKAVQRLRTQVPAIALTTDVIVGFPTETEAEFEQTRSLLEEIGFDNAFIFKYSPRPGTPAAAWPDDIPAAEKLRRNHALLEDQDRRGTRINCALIGQPVEVLVEGPSARNTERWAGRSRTNKVVIFDPREGQRAGDIVNVTIARATAQTLYGKVQG